MLHLLEEFLPQIGLLELTWQQAVMIGVGCLLIYLGISKRYEPLLLVPIGFGAMLANLPLAGLTAEGGLLYYLYAIGIETGIFPPLIFLGIGALTDFGPLIAKPGTFLLGAAAQFGIFGTLIGAQALGFSFPEAAAIANIGGANGPSAIFVGSILAPELLGPIAVAAYSYMALVPIIQPPIIRGMTTRRERTTVMSEMKPVSRRARILFPIVVTLVSALFVPDSAPLVGMLMLGNLFREAGVVDRLTRTAQNELINVVTILLSAAIGSRMEAAAFLNVQTLIIIAMGLVAFALGTASGVLLGKLMYLVTGGGVNPMIGAAGVAAVPMSARVVQRIGQQENPNNYLLMNAMGPNVAGTVGSTVAAGILLAFAG